MQVLITELRKTYDGDPLLRINGSYFLLTSPFEIHLALEELHSLETGLEIKFENFKQFNKLLNQINTLKFLDLSCIPTEKLLAELKRRIKEWRVTTND